MEEDSGGRVLFNSGLSGGNDSCGEPRTELCSWQFLFRV